MHDKEASRAVMGLLEGLSDAEIRACGIEALRRWRKRPTPPSRAPGYVGTDHAPPRDPVDAPTQDVFSMHGDFGLELVPLLAERKKLAKPNSNSLKEVFIDHDAMAMTWMQGVSEFIWWLLRTGLAVEVQRSREDQLILLRLTRRGSLLIDGSDSNPLLPGFLDRIGERCPDLPDGVVALLVDARACLDHSLRRPAVVLMGVAYELAIEKVVDVLVTKNLVPGNTPDQKPAERIRRIKALIASPTVSAVLATPDERTAALSAYDFADTLRLRRNEAAHTSPRFDFDHGGETEEFLVSAGRHIPALWSLAL